MYLYSLIIYKNYSPLEQFEILVYKYNFFLLSFLNLTIFIFIIVFFIYLYIYLNMSVLFYNLLIILNRVTRVNIIIKYKKTVLFFMNIVFIFILFNNLSGMFPYINGVTSQITITFYLSFVFFISLNILGINLHNLNFIQLFIIKGIPFILKLFLFFIELLSYIARIFSISIRLFANITSGHILMKILSTFLFLMVFSFNLKLFLFLFLLFTLIFIIIFLETFIGALQAYVFVMLFNLYFNDVLNLH